MSISAKLTAYEIHFYDLLETIYVWIYENEPKELKSRPKRAFFLFLARIKKKVSPLFFLYPFIFFFLYFFSARLLDLEAA